MRRHRTLVLVPALLLGAACTRGDDAQSATASPLDRDLTLSAQLQTASALPSATDLLASGGACQRGPAPATPTAAQRAQAVAFEQRAAEAEFVGNVKAARDLHRQAARLDGTSEEIAYRLARAEEAVGDKAAAVKGYCRFLSLAPTAANAKDARARLSSLLPSPTTQVAAQPATASTPASTPATAAPRTVATARGNRARARTVSAPAAVAAVTPSPVSATPVVTQTPAESSAAATASGPTPDSTVYTSSAGEVVAQQQTPAPVETPSAPAPAARRGTDHTVRNAAIGAAAGAAVGAITSRSAKGAAIGGVAGGILGAVIGRVTRTDGGGTTTFRTPGWAH